MLFGGSLLFCVFCLAIIVNDYNGSHSGVQAGSQGHGSKEEEEEEDIP